MPRLSWVSDLLRQNQIENPAPAPKTSFPTTPRRLLTKDVENVQKNAEKNAGDYQDKKRKASSSSATDDAVAEHTGEEHTDEVLSHLFRQLMSPWQRCCTPVKKSPILPASLQPAKSGNNLEQPAKPGTIDFVPGKNDLNSLLSQGTSETGKNDLNSLLRRGTAEPANDLNSLLSQKIKTESLAEVIVISSLEQRIKRRRLCRHNSNSSISSSICPGRTATKVDQVDHKHESAESRTSGSTSTSDTISQSSAQVVPGKVVPGNCTSDIISLDDILKDLFPSQSLFYTDNCTSSTSSAGSTAPSASDKIIQRIALRTKNQVRIPQPSGGIMRPPLPAAPLKVSYKIPDNSILRRARKSMDRIKKTVRFVEDVIG